MSALGSPFCAPGLPKPSLPWESCKLPLPGPNPWQLFKALFSSPLTSSFQVNAFLRSITARSLQLASWKSLTGGALEEGSSPNCSSPEESRIGDALAPRSNGRAAATQRQPDEKERKNEVEKVWLPPFSYDAGAPLPAGKSSSRRQPRAPLTGSLTFHKRGHGLLGAVASPCLSGASSFVAGGAEGQTGLWQGISELIFIGRGCSYSPAWGKVQR